ncbi:protein of unknown function [Bradyrhizobium vignae]|uniref:Uncharacterized protein n=1 Tax=Bradyrhizobium vignae TaxID=1549949 RepID=A0A2U3Q1I8_9BRAD|nr:protein of unknown function [Bradyrhizobium vignae]
MSTHGRENIPLYRNSELAYVSPIPAHSRGAIMEVVIVASRACGGRSSVVYEMSRAGRIALREPEASCGRAALSGSSRQHFGGNVHNAVEPCGANEPCVRQNRVVLAVVATVKRLRMRQSRQPARLPVNSASVREARRNSAPGRARHKPSDHRAGKAE